MDVEGENEKQKTKQMEAEANIAVAPPLAERGSWGGKIEFMLTCISYAVGLGNVWRFPYLCYKNGGGAFLIPYVIMLALVGLPLFFLEMAFGQFASLGPLAIWRVSPLMKGLGYAMVICSALISIYYTVIIAYTVYYLFASMQSPVPWSICGVNNETESVAEWWLRGTCVTSDKINTTLDNGTTTLINVVFKGTRDGEAPLPFPVKSPSEHYFYDRVLDILPAIDAADIGAPQWHLSLCLLLSWILVALALIKGVETLGKVSYLTAIFPYILLTVLIINGALLEGSLEGVLYYIEPDFTRLSDINVWKDAAVQIFYSLGVCTGGLITMSSFNDFRNNCLKDAILVAVINCATSVYAGFAIFSIIGYMAHKANIKVEDVATKGPGLAFVVYPEGLSLLPGAPFWGVLFFFMMFTLGMGSTLSMMENVLSSLLDEFPRFRSSPWKNAASRGIVCLICFLLGLPMVCRGGMYLLHLVDVSVSSYPLLIIAVLELVALNYIYGYEAFAEDVELMLGKRPNIYFQICWRFVSGVVILAIIVFSAIEPHSIAFNDYLFPASYQVLGALVQATPMMAIVLLAFVGIWTGTPLCVRWWKEVKDVARPESDWGPAKKENRQGKYADPSAVSYSVTGGGLYGIGDTGNAVYETPNDADYDGDVSKWKGHINQGADVFETYM